MTVGVFIFVCFVFFFQAEDGIRDFCLSRGLGDVYKRQPEHLTTVEFYHDLKNCLNKNGIILSNSVGDFSINDTLNSVLSLSLIHI